MFNQAHFDNSRGDGFPVLEIAGTQGAPLQFVPLQRTELRGVVAGPLADLTLTQHFGFSARQSTDIVEALYRFPLPGDAAVRGVEVCFGDVTILATLKPRREAEAEYGAAKEAGKQAILATRGGADTFTLRVAGIRSDQPVTVVTRYVQLARPDGLGWSLRVPLTLAPRYVRQDESQGHAPEQRPLGILRDPGHRFRLELTVMGAGTVTSPTHDVVATSSEGGVQVRPAEGEVVPDRDFVLRWALPQEETRPSLHVHAHDDPAAGFIYFMAQVAPPQAGISGPQHDLRSDLQPGLHREVTLLVDHSGSMTGPKWEAADWATEQLLRSFTAQDAFGLGVFHNNTAWFAPQLQPGDPSTVEQAAAWFKTKRDSGGTELGVALEQALRLAKGRGEAARAVLIITDGQVTDHDRLFQLADREFASPQKRRISVLCIDSAPNDFLARQLAERGGGMARFLTSNPDEEDITTALDTILADWAAPALTGLRLVVDRAEVHAVQHRVVAAAHAGEAAVDLGDLPAGRVIWVAGRVPRGTTTELTLHLELPDGTRVAEAAVTPGDFPSLAALFAGHRINELEYLMRAYTLQPEEVARRLADLGFPADVPAGVQPTTPPILYAENQRTAWQEMMAALIQTESLASGIPSSETAFVAVRQEVGQTVTRTVAVANALPQDWSAEFIGGRAMAAMPSGARGKALFSSMVRTFDATLAQPSPALMAQALPSAVGSKPRTGGQVLLYRGAPGDLLNNRVLLDTGDRPEALPAPLTLTAVSWTGDAAAQEALARAGALQLAIYVGDMAVARAGVRLADLAAAGRRPLNLRCRRGDRVRVVIEGDPGALPADGAGQMELRLIW